MVSDLVRMSVKKKSLKYLEASFVPHNHKKSMFHPKNRKLKKIKLTNNVFAMMIVKYNQLF
jgi:hypothetical protein